MTDSLVFFGSMKNATVSWSGSFLLSRSLKKCKGHGHITDDQSARVDGGRFHILWVDPDIANVRIGERYQLARIGWIRQDFLVTGHRGIEDDFADGKSVRTNRAPEKSRAVREQK